eukprot:TRINITY_DN20702_c0_g1_i3.p1 TRINITY_DN20702_c0_g1~~TRINITY_DN20702_c0_g1_i3.p1  ORF type:complete len:236 (+),score=34.81 TRINITY_DN20702_c0_g1_i3:702-1409(+)
MAANCKIRRTVCGTYCLLAEGEDSTLAYYAHFLHLTPQLDPYPLCGAVALPLRHFAAGWEVFILVDALGAVFTTAFITSPGQPRRVHLPEGRRAVRVAGARTRWDTGCGPVRVLLVALTECGELRDCGTGTSCPWNLTRRITSISAAHPGLPLGLRPYGGYEAHRILLLPDRCCGKARLRLAARIAVRLVLPSDLLREVLMPFAVADCYVVGPPHEPFCWPVRQADGTAAAAAGH